MLVRLIVLFVDFFDLERFEKAFHRCVVIAVSFATHALEEAMAFQAIAVGQASELNTSVAVDDQSWSWVSQGDCLVKCLEGEA